MYENFQNISQEKRKRIIDACFNEFAEKGYEMASTNSIVKNAGISKGILFHYFGCKKNIYLYVLDYVTEYYIDYMLKCMKVNNPDFFKRIIEWTELKIYISTQNPLLYKFFTNAYINIPEELKEDIKKRYNDLYAKGYVLAFEGLDMSKFRDDIDKTKMFEIIMFVINGLSQKYLHIVESSADKGYSMMEKVLDETKKYVEIMRKVFYKN